MSDEKNPVPPESGDEPTAARSHLPMWILVVTLMLLYLGGIYFDRHSGWFDKQVYSTLCQRGDAGFLSAEVRCGGGSGAGQKNL